MKRQSKRKGFTLVELLVVIAILAILATVSVVGYTAFITRAHKSNAQSEAAQLDKIIKSALVTEGKYEIGQDGETSPSLISISKLASATSYTVNDGTDAATKAQIKAAVAKNNDLKGLEGEITIISGGSTLVYIYTKASKPLYITIDLNTGIGEGISEPTETAPTNIVS